MVLSYSQSCLLSVGPSTKSLSLIHTKKRIGIKKKSLRIRTEISRKIGKWREIKTMTGREIKNETRRGREKGKRKGRDNKSWKIMRLLILEGLFRNKTIVNMISISCELFLTLNIYNLTKLSIFIFEKT